MSRPRTAAEPIIDVPVTAPRDPGWLDLLRVIDEARSGEIESPEEVARRIGWDGFLWLLRERLDAIYPADVFRWREVQYGVTWAGEHGGSDIDPGVKWIALLRLALEVVEPSR